jgi:hypothetical protein
MTMQGGLIECVRLARVSILRARATAQEVQFVRDLMKREPPSPLLQERLDNLSAEARDARRIAREHLQSAERANASLYVWLGSDYTRPLKEALCGKDFRNWPEYGDVYMLSDLFWGDDPT